MRYAALLFPRLAIQLTRRVRPELAGRPFALAAGSGDAALLTAVSVEATSDGVEPGMTQLQARQRCPGLVVQPDNAAACLEALEGAVTILRSRATTNVAIVSRSCVAIELDGIQGQFADEGAAAIGLAGMIRNWSGLDVRVAVASSIEDAACAARTARRFPVIRPDSNSIPAGALPVHEPVSAAASFAQPASASEAQGRLWRMLSALGGVVDEYGQSYREVRLEIEHGPYRRALSLRASAPIHGVEEAIELLRTRVEASAFEGATNVRVILDRPGPKVSVEPWRAPMAQFHRLSGPAVPIQRRLLRAS